MIYEGYMFVDSGHEHGPTIMIREEGWDQDLFDELRAKLNVDNEFDNVNFASKITPHLEPGTKYRLTIEEID